jgi:SAM-dependent methyltransferase
MPSFEDSAVSQAPPEEVWKLLYDPSRFPEWWAGIETVETGEGAFTYYPEGGPDLPRPQLLDTVREERRIVVSCLVTDLRVDWRLEPANVGTATLIRVSVEAPESQAELLDAQRAVVSRSLARLSELAAGAALDRDIAAYYALDAERDRLREPGGRLEFVRTQELLARFLPSPPAIIADVGGGTGVYALPLATAGYEVHLLDPVELHVERALALAREQQAPLASAQVGDARRVPYADASTDAVLLLGPLYHLTDRGARLAALGEAHRVLRPGGLIVAAAISRFASTFDGIARGFLAEPRFERVVERDVREGQHRNPDPEGRPEWFTTAYFHHPDELRRELHDARFRVETVVAVEGPGAFRPELDAWLEDLERRDTLLRAIRRLESEPTVLGASAHLLAFGRR